MKKKDAEVRETIRTSRSSVEKTGFGVEKDTEVRRTGQTNKHPSTRLSFIIYIDKSIDFIFCVGSCVGSCVDFFRKRKINKRLKVFLVFSV